MTYFLLSEEGQNREVPCTAAVCPPCPIWTQSDPTFLVERNPHSSEKGHQNNLPFNAQLQLLLQACDLHHEEKPYTTGDMDII